MSDNAKIESTSQSASSAPSAERRRLLRAAAVSAPFIATLPSGAALANSSAFQCIPEEGAASQEQFDAHGAEFAAKTTADQYLRAVTSGYNYVEEATGTTHAWYVWEDNWYRTDENPPEPWKRKKRGRKDDRKDEYRKGGEGAEYEWRGRNRKWTRTGPVSFHLLVVGKPDTGTTGNSDLPTGFTFAGAYPTEKPGLGQTELMGVSGSCACSINPNLTDEKGNSICSV